MKVTRVQIVARGLANRCPNCGAPTLFKAGKLFETNKRCTACHFTIERENDEGFYLGSASLNFGMTIILCLVPILLLWYFKVIGDLPAGILAVVGALGFPVLFYRSSRSWWLMNYYVLFPHHLPANGGKGRLGEDDNV